MAELEEIMARRVLGAALAELNRDYRRRALDDALATHELVTLYDHGRLADDGCPHHED